MKPIECLVSVVRAAANFNEKTQASPAAVLWTDKECQWQAAMPLIKKYLPELIELGDYQPEQRVGPAVWIKCAIAGKVVEIPTDPTPIIYLPGIARKELRAIELCPDHLLPLAELQYRGFWWATPNNGRDWTASAFLSNSKVGIGMDIAKDAKTQAALLSVLPELLVEEVEDMQGRRLEADDLLRLVVGDPQRDLLLWLDDPDIRDTWPSNQQQIFDQTCVTTFSLEPSLENRETFAQSMCEQQGAWADLWTRFSEMAGRLPNLIELLSTIKPRDLLFERSAFPIANQEEESALHKALVELAATGDDELVRTGLKELYLAHEERRQWLWAELDLSPYLGMLSALVEVDKYTQEVFAGPDVEAMAAAYKAKHWRADAAALEAMAAAKDDAQRKVVADALAIIYTPWLTRVAENFQHLVQDFGYPGAASDEIKEVSANYKVASQLLFFVDGLRFDVAQQLQDRLAVIADVHMSAHWAALPSLTATAKAAITPVQIQLSGALSNDDFVPIVKDTNQVFSSHHLKRLLDEQDWQFLKAVETGNVAGRAWVQTGDLDHAGHDEQLRLPSRISEVLDEIEARVNGLLEAGWMHIRIVTDHGWLWVPDQLPKTELPKDATSKRFSRCAILKSNVVTDRLSQPWYWNQEVRVALAPGISGFTAGDYYNHGGLTLQECLTPVLNISAKV